MIERIVGTLIEFIALGGPVVVLQLLTSVGALALIVLKIWQFRRLGVGRHGEAEAVLARWERGDRAAALAMARRGRAQLTSLVSATMVSLMSSADPDSTRQRSEAEAEASLHTLEKGFRALDAITQLSPMLGLFGTVVGIIETFQGMQAAGDTVDPSMLAGGIWVALLTTAVGLAIAMTTSLTLTWFESRAADERMATQTALSILLAPGHGAPEDRPGVPAGATQAGPVRGTPRHAT